MKSRPWPVVILALFHFFAPVGNVLVSAGMQGLSPQLYFQGLIRQNSVLDLSAFFGLFPLAGLAIYLYKRWSYAAFLGILGLTVMSNFRVWSEYPNIFGMPMLLGSYLVNAGVVSYFLIPAVRAPFMNQRLRWWETKPRYSVRLRAETQDEQGVKKVGVVQDIAEGGVFLRTTRKFSQNQQIRISFAALNQEFSLEGKVVYRRTRGQAGYGIQFVHSTESSAALRKLVKGFRSLGVQTRDKFDWKVDLKSWVTTAVTTGKGLVPEIPQHLLAPAPSPSTSNVVSIDAAVKNKAEAEEKKKAA